MEIERMRMRTNIRKRARMRRSEVQISESFQSESSKEGGYVRPCAMGLRNHPSYTGHIIMSLGTLEITEGHYGHIISLGTLETNYY